MSWTPKRINQLGEVSRGRSRHRPRDASHLYGGPFPFIQTADVKHAGLFITSHQQTYSEAGLAQSKLWPAGTLCVTIAANIADTAILSYDACFPDSVIGFIPDPTKADARFIKYFFEATLQRRFKQFTQGAAQDNLSQEKLLSLDLVVPDVLEQQRLADVLAAYDDLIENNRRRIQLLEQSARLLYREWFVHLRFPGHEHVRVVDGVPEGWERRTMSDVAETIGGGTPSTSVSAYWENGTVTWFTPTDLTGNDCLALLNSEKRISEEGLKNSSAKMLPPDTILMSSRASIGYFGLHDKPACTNQGFISLIPRDDTYRYYLLHNLMHRKDEIISHAGGTTYKEINKSTFRALPITVPGSLLASEFAGFAHDVMQQTRTLKKQIVKLREARDLLLPRLMSGEITV